MNKLYVGSLNNIKIQACKEVFKEYQVIGVKSSSGVSVQPFSQEETMQGAYNRAISLPIDGLRLGLEAGITKINDLYFLINFGCLIDENDNVYYAAGTYVPIDKKIIDLLIEKKLELKDAIHLLYNEKDINKTKGTISLLTNNEISRLDIFIHINKLLKGQMTRKVKL